MRKENVGFPKAREFGADILVIESQYRFDAGILQQTMHDQQPVISGTRRCDRQRCLRLETQMLIRPIKRLSKSKPTLEGAGVHLHRTFGYN